MVQRDYQVRDADGRDHHPWRPLSLWAVGSLGLHRLNSTG